MAKVLLTAIMRGDSEYDLAKRMLESFMPYMDGLAVAITGTEPNKKLKALIKGHGGRCVVTNPESHPKIYHKGKFANFAEARNVSWKLAEEMQVKGKYDWWAWADVDDILMGGNELKKVAEDMKDSIVDDVAFTYWYAVEVAKNGDIKNILIDHVRERLLRPHRFKWVSRLHEVTMPLQEGYEPKHTIYSLKHGKVAWIHLPPKTEEHVMRGLLRNKEILELQLEEEKSKDPRTLFYYGKVCQDLAKTEEYRPLLFEAKKVFEKYIPMSGWEQERANAYQYLGDIAVTEGDQQQAIMYYMDGIREDPKNHLIHLNLSKTYFETNHMEKAEEWLNKAINLEAPEAGSTIGNPADIKLFSASLKFNLAMAKNDLKEARHWIQVRSKINGDDESERVKMLTDLIDLDDQAHKVFEYAMWLKDKGHERQLIALLDSIAPEMENEAFVQKIANDVIPPKQWPIKSIVYYAGQSFEQWSPNSLSKGIGGSESAIIYLARLWAKAGYKVTVYANVGAEEGTYEGVEYKHHTKMNFKDTFDTFIAWRNPGLMEIPIKANKVLFDAHDQLSQLDWPDHRVENVKYFMFKTKYHREMLPKIPDSKCKIIGNGIIK